MTQKRNYGIDLLRIVATFMVLVLHVLGAGGIVNAIDASSSIYITSWALRMAAYCAVNCYGLISGYVGVRARFRLSNLMLLWLQVSLTGVVLTVSSYFLGAEVTLLDLASSSMPLIYEMFWYFTAYVCVYLLSPFLNQLIEKLDKSNTIMMFVVLTVLFSIIPTFLHIDKFGVNSGYSATWLAVLYLVGGAIRKHYAESKVKKKILLGGYLLAVALTLFTKLGIEYLGFTLYTSDFLMSYNSPTMVMAGVCLLLLFANLDVERFKKPISFFAPFTFGVYIIHSHPVIYNNFIANRFTSFTEMHPVVFVLALLLLVTVIFMACSVMEFLRIKLFMLLHLKELCKFIENKVVVFTKRILKYDRENIG